MDPQLATDLDWRTVRYPVAVEPKINGCRCVVAVDATGGVHPFSRRGTEWTAITPALAHLARFPGQTFDGEIVVGGTWGRTNGAIHRKRLTADTLATVVYHIFDLPSHPGTYTERRGELLRLGVPGVVESRVCLGRAEVQAEYARVVAAGGEGVVVKAIDSRYQPGARTNDWMKMKPQPTTDVFEGGRWLEYRPSGALLRVRDDKAVPVGA
jgi:ATP-dependent DNA ligase